uniref:Major facilitator superfamily (MFS) profile domain-containing protein n=1 Tax=Romanomermis culicivorax TaxID=13658 RepID=A0A915JZM4_ROMCU
RPVVAWNAQTLGVVEGSFFYGYLLTQLPGGFISAKFPANKLFGLAIGVTSFFNLFMPTACNAGSGMVVIIQIMQGLSQGVAYPAMHGVWRFWAPPLERTKLVTTAFTGSYAGAVIGLPLSAILVSAIGWQAPFYLYGFFGCIWFVFWWFMTFEKPCKHPTISDEEKDHIESSIGHTAHVLPTIHNVPWKSILTSKCVWAIIVANFCRSWTFYLLLIHQLSYMRDVLGMRIQNSGFWAAMPHVVMSIVVLVGGQIADHLRQKGILSTTSVRKIFNCGGFGMEAVFLIICAYTRSKTGAIASLIFAVGFSGFAISDLFVRQKRKNQTCTEKLASETNLRFNVNHLDLAPRYASILMGMSNGMGTFAGMICPAVTEKLTKTYVTKIGSIGYGTMINNGNDGDLNYQSFQINNKKYSNASNLSGAETLTGQNGRHDSINGR